MDSGMEPHWLHRLGSRSFLVLRGGRPRCCDALLLLQREGEEPRIGIDTLSASFTSCPELRASPVSAKLDKRMLLWLERVANQASCGSRTRKGRNWQPKQTPSQPRESRGSTSGRHWQRESAASAAATASDLLGWPV